MAVSLPYSHVDSSLRALAAQAEGFGRLAIGGLHGPLYHVTTLAGNLNVFYLTPSFNSCTLLCKMYLFWVLVTQRVKGIVATCNSFYYLGLVSYAKFVEVYLTIELGIFSFDVYLACQIQIQNLCPGSLHICVCVGCDCR